MVSDANLYMVDEKEASITYDHSAAGVRFVSPFLVGLPFPFP
jgi:hypothetical protein